MSLDGYIATKDDGLDWLSIVEQEGQDYGYQALQDSVDTYLVGRRTYDTVMKLTGGSFPQAQQLRCFVLTRQARAPEQGVTFYSGDIEALIDQLQQEEGKHIYCDGGGQIVKLLMEKNLIDEYIISVIPTLLGDGIPLFIGGTESIRLKTLSSKQYDSGLIQLHYERVK